MRLRRSTLRKTLGEDPAGADAHLCEAAAEGDPRNRRHQGDGAYHRRRLRRQHPARAAGKRSWRMSTFRAWRLAAGVRLAFARLAAWRRSRNAAHLQLRRRHGDRRRSGKGFRRARIAWRQAAKRSWNSACWRMAAASACASPGACGFERCAQEARRRADFRARHQHGRADRGCEEILPIRRRSSA